MTPELLHLYQELYKTGGYFYRNPPKPGLHLIVLDKPKAYLSYEFGVPEVRIQLLLHLFGPEDLQPTLSSTELLLCQLSVIQYRGKQPCSNLPKL